MEWTQADETRHIGQVLLALAGVLAITLAGIGVIVRMTPPMDGTAIYWWWAALACAAAGVLVWAVAVGLSQRPPAEPQDTP